MPPLLVLRSFCDRLGTGRRGREHKEVAELVLNSISCVLHVMERTQPKGCFVCMPVRAVSWIACLLITNYELVCADRVM